MPRFGNIVLALLLTYLAAMAVAKGASLLRGRGHTYGWWDGGALLRGRELSKRATVLSLLLDVVMLGAGVFFLTR